MAAAFEHVGVLNRVGSSRTRRVYRTGVAAAVFLLHGAALLSLVVNRNVGTDQSDRQDNAIAWVKLSPTPAETAPKANRNPPLVSIKIPAPSTSDITRHLPQEDTDAALAALKDYVTCGLKNDRPSWEEDQRRCAETVGSLPRGMDMPRRPTEREVQLAKKFAHDLAVQRAPILLPCMSPNGHVSVRCLLNGINNGFDIGSYADRHNIDR